MPEEREALLQHYRDMQAEILGAIEGLTDAQMSERTIDGWSVVDHLGHLSLWDDVRAAEVERISAGQATTWLMTTEQDAAYSLLGHDLRLNMTPSQARWEIENSTKHLMDAIANATLRGLEPQFYGEAPVKSSHKAQHAGWIRRWRGERGY